MQYSLSHAMHVVLLLMDAPFHSAEAEIWTAVPNRSKSRTFDSNFSTHVRDKKCSLFSLCMRNSLEKKS